MDRKMAHRVIVAGLLLILLIIQTGCTTQKGRATGWMFQIGVAPITDVDNNQGLKTEPRRVKTPSKDDEY